MDILTHLVSGAVVGAALGLLAGPRTTRPLVLPVLGWLGAGLPDQDALSRSGIYRALATRWSLPPGGDVYGGTAWYSHHHFFHSIALGLGTAALVGLACAGLGRKLRLPPSWLAGSTFLLGFLAHLVGDLPTPASVWGGIQMFWPLPDMVGGWGLTWWWNNYDLLLILLVQLALLLALFPFRARVRAVRATTGVVLVAGVLLLVRQLHDRETSYAYTGNTPRYDALESASLAEQRRILPDPLYGLFRKVDSRMPVPF